MDGRLGWRAGLLVASLAGYVLTPAVARDRGMNRDISSLQTRGAEMGTALLEEYYNELPQPRPAETARAWQARMQAALEKFQENVKARYTEATLQRLLDCPRANGRQAAVLALGLLGTMESNAVVAAMLHDEDRLVKQLAADALWSLWFRADTVAHNQELRRLLRETDPKKALAGLDKLIKKAPSFAEAYNQRAIVYFRLDDFQHCVTDCETVLRFNPFHFGAQWGLAQSYMKLNKPRAALKAFRHTLKINPNMEGVEDTIHFLETALGEEGKKDDKK
jgi:tetratricopeptide (TPR) repeat protein